ncbi:MAG: porin [Bacteroidia bacterium]|jgi:hypothetical protein|nr:porin [Bacteroidia bacterium]
MKKAFTFFVSALASAAWLNAQTPATDKPAEDHSYKPILFKLNEDGSKYFRFMFWNQTWLKFTQTNPGTLDYDGETVNNTASIGLRRTRVLFYGQVSSRFMLLMHLGINNQTYTNGGLTGATGNNRAKKPQLFFHDVLTEYTIVKNKLHIGAGLHYYNGPSRQSSNSTISFFAIDAPIFNWPEIETNDQFARQMGLYAKGQLGRFDYRVSFNQPFDIGGSYKALDSTKIYATEIAHRTWGSQGYFNWQFKDRESNFLPFFAGTHLGAKEVFNIGIGYYYHPQATAHFDTTAGQPVRDDIMHLAADVFWEKPVNKEKNTMFHLYATVYRTNFGPGYLRNVGIMNVSAGVPGNSSQLTFSGTGNAEPLIGTGTILYAETGFLLPKMGNRGQLMPYVTYTYNQFDRLNSSTDHFNVGVNYLLNGNNAKITAHYSMRSIVSNTTLEKTGMRGEAVVQFQIML